MTIEEDDKDRFESLHAGVLTVSDSRAELMKRGRDEDQSGKIIQRKLREVGITSTRTILPDEKAEIREGLRELLDDPEVDLVITTGGTGITSRDITVDVAREFFDREIPGFGELLRRRGYEEVGFAGILTRTTLGLAEQKPVFCLPGSPNSVSIAMDIIIPQLSSLVLHDR